MYMNLRPNKHKRISFNTMTMASLGFIIGPPKLMAMAGAAATMEVQPPPPPPGFFLEQPIADI